MNRSIKLLITLCLFNTWVYTSHISNDQLIASVYAAASVNAQNNLHSSANVLNDSESRLLPKDLFLDKDDNQAGIASHPLIARENRVGFTPPLHCQDWAAVSTEAHDIWNPSTHSNNVTPWLYNSEMNKHQHFHFNHNIFNQQNNRLPMSRPAHQSINAHNLRTHSAALPSYTSTGQDDNARNNTINRHLAPVSYIPQVNVPAVRTAPAQVAPGALMSYQFSQALRSWDDKVSNPATSNQELLNILQSIPKEELNIYDEFGKTIAHRFVPVFWHGTILYTALELGVDFTIPTRHSNYTLAHKIALGLSNHKKTYYITTRLHTLVQLYHLDNGRHFNLKQTADNKNVLDLLNDAGYLESFNELLKSTPKPVASKN